MMEQYLDCLEIVVEVVSLVLVAPMDSTSEVLDEGKDFSLLALKKKNLHLKCIYISNTTKMSCVHLSLTFLKPSGPVSCCLQLVASYHS